MHQIPAYRRIARTVIGAAAALALLTGAGACRVVDRPIQVDHAWPASTAVPVRR